MKSGLLYFLQKLLDSLPEKIYAAKWNEDTDIYRIFSMYANEFASGSAHLETLEEDLDIDFCRNLKIYDNFGAYTGVGKYEYQTYNTDEYDSVSGSTICYRKQTKYLIISSLHGGTNEAVNYAGRAFTGVTPDIDEGYDTPRWKLTYTSGSARRGFDSSKSYYYIEDTTVSWPAHKFEGALCRFPTDSEIFYLKVVDSDENRLYFDSLDNEIGGVSAYFEYSASFSFLEHNTKIYKEKDRLKGATLRVWIPSCYNNSERKGHIENFMKKVVPAATSLIFDWESRYVTQTTYAQFSLGSYDSSYFRVDEDGSVTNIARTTF